MSLEHSEHENQHNIRFGFGAGVDPKLQVNFESRFGFPLVEAWAMTETGAGAVISAHLADRLVAQSCLGAPCGWVEARVVNDDGDDAGRQSTLRLFFTLL